MRKFGVITSLMIYLLLGEYSYSQIDSFQLAKLDSIAFAALETNDTDVSSKANELLRAGQDSNSALHQINAYTILGILNKNKGYFVTAVDYYNKALNVAEESNDQGRVSACLNNIGSVYKIQENYTKALVYFKRSLAIEEKLNNPLQKSIRLYNMGEIYREMDSMSLALTNYNSSLLIEKEYKNSEGIVYALLGVSDIYLQLDRAADASISLNEAKKYVKESDLEINILYHLLKADLLHNEGRIDDALLFLQTAKETSERNNFRVHLVDIYEKEIEIKQTKAELQQSNLQTEKEPKVSYLFWIVVSLVVLCLIGLVFFLWKSQTKKNRTKDYKNSDESQIFELKSTSNKVLLQVDLKSILYFEANDNYVVVYYFSPDKELLKSMERVSLRKIESILNPLNTNFLRVHKSYLVNPDFVEKVTGKSQAYKLLIKGLESTIPVSRSFDIHLLKR